MINRIAILGTGLLGTSIGLALRAANFSGTITGWNRTPAEAELALQMGALDSIAPDPHQAAIASDVTLLAIPIHATLDFMGAARAHPHSRPARHRRWQHQGPDIRRRHPPVQHP